MSACDVAVVGYGPTGMVLAALLGAQGHRVTVLERYTGLYNLPRAACFDDEIMRTFQKLGLAEAIGRGAVVQRDYEWVNAAGETLVEIAYADPAPCGWAQLYMMFQPHVEDVLDRHDKALPNVEVRQGVTVTELRQDEDGVVLRGTDAAGAPVDLRARYVVGADGGNGLTRRVVSPETEDYGFQENWLVCDFRMSRAVPGLPSFRQVCDPAQPTSIVTIGPDHHRFSFMLNPGETAEEATRPERVWARVSRYITPEDAAMIRVVNYVFRSRIAARWRLGRVLLAGDAAHEMPPFLAQGMCSGIRDAHNLAFKLDMVLRGQAGDAILDTYRPEREPHVRFITERAIELGRVQTMRDPDAARARDERLLAARRARQAPEKLQFPALRGGLIANHGGLFPQGRLRHGERTALFDDLVGPGWCLVTLDPALPAALLPEARGAWDAIGGRVAVLSPEGGLEDADGTYRDWFAANGGTAAVVRPDWYVYGTAGTAAGLAALLEALGRALRPADALVAS
ncbi:bifunctional 3-(3-hydroxy-phenyl)propionate/3-hydroxycinnamic acid hydroxylase [Roseomonas nepalensis]|uniref:Bifunctional 3-(3-hydroxy-phenyl)propionate/3-hydroxycinnamic acid hydroxylase n=1 Tax=Muricoccus nepalensis TaxID=1854500 RepID=A0A502F8S4_9PROT|nr:bifunctional 3-(3-hydroxy-phenyl)propionate/3-hydroxycinnamic acid hydroxylase [Roseomonas nepalensis]TPG45757.1 bifunctional 3-(3-hydroxy-phenyl)propionate/3-hydroxycinnamic acid hydroxylase [Roseomonas nepalensis]